MQWIASMHIDPLEAQGEPSPHSVSTGISRIHRLMEKAINELLLEVSDLPPEPEVADAVFLVHAVADVANRSQQIAQKQLLILHMMDRRDREAEAWRRRLITLAVGVCATAFGAVVASSALLGLAVILLLQAG